MNEPLQPSCPECEEPIDLAPALDRRRFIRVIGGGVAALAAGAGAVPRLLAAPEAAPKAVKPAEALVHELYSTLTDTQKKTIVLPWSHGSAAAPTRQKVANGALMGQRLGQIYTKPQQELIEKVLRSILNGEDAYKRVSRNNSWDNSKAFENCGCHLFGEPVPGKQFAWLFTGHHLTMRCDGNLTDGMPFGGPLYYGHTANGYSDANVYNFQTKSVLTVYKALDAKQQGKAVVTGDPGDREAGIRFRKPGEAKPGLAMQDMNAEQRVLVEKAMEDILALFRKEDAAEVLGSIKANGGLEKIHLAYYKDKGAADNERWHYWRLEGPGFIWNYRVLPHVHCYVNIVPAKV